MVISSFSTWSSSHTWCPPSWRSDTLLSELVWCWGSVSSGVSSSRPCAVFPQPLGASLGCLSFWRDSVTAVRWGLGRAALVRWFPARGKGWAVLPKGVPDHCVLLA